MNPNYWILKCVGHYVPPGSFESKDYRCNTFGGI
jgi:hypothetical protein